MGLHSPHMTSQLEFLRPGVTESDVEEFRARLAAQGWQTRRQIVQATGWSERKIRDVAESLGADVVRGQPGFKLTEHLTREDLEAAKQAADAAISQAKKQMHYGLELLKKLHAQIG